MYARPKSYKSGCEVLQYDYLEIVILGRWSLI